MCDQCGAIIGDRWYRTHLKTGRTVHVLCLMTLWDHGDYAQRKPTTAERMKELRKWSPVQMPTNHLPTAREGL